MDHLPPRFPYTHWLTLFVLRVSFEKGSAASCGVIFFEKNVMILLGFVPLRQQLQRNSIRTVELFQQQQQQPLKYAHNPHLMKRTPLISTECSEPDTHDFDLFSLDMHLLTCRLSEIDTCGSIAPSHVQLSLVFVELVCVTMANFALPRRLQIV